MTSKGNTMIEKANPEMLCAEMTKLKKKTDTLYNGLEFGDLLELVCKCYTGALM